MSLWKRTREPSGRRSLYLVDLPWERALLVIGIFVAVLAFLVRRFF